MLDGGFCYLQIIDLGLGDFLVLIGIAKNLF